MERLNKTMADMLSMYVDVEHNTWDEIVYNVTFAYNTAFQEATRMTLFKFVYGKQPTTIIDAVLPLVKDDKLMACVQGYLIQVEGTCSLLTFIQRTSSW